MDQLKNDQPFSYIYGGDTLSVASYEEIFTLPRKLERKVEEHSYISFLDAQKTQYTLDDVLSTKPFLSRKFICLVPRRVLVIAIAILFLIITLILLAVTDNFSGLWKKTTVPALIPYEGSDWFVRAEQWGMKRSFDNCPAFKKVTKVTVTQIVFEDETCNDIKACEQYLAAYDNNRTVLHNFQWEYEFFFGNDKHVFEGRNWYCFYNPGELRFGYLGNYYDPNDLGPAWGNIHYTIIEFGIQNDLVVSNVYYDVTSKKL